VTVRETVLEDSAEDLFEEAPCGYLATDLDGLIVRVNRAFERWTGFDRAQLLGQRRFQDLLAPGARIYHETHYAPLLRMQGSVREIALELVGSDGSRLPALVNSVLHRDRDGRPQLIRTTVFDASDRRRYEQELLRSQRHEHEVAQRLQQSMLSGALPTAPGLQVEVAYQPSEGGLDIGGDWYDAFWLDDEGDAIGLVVGDVVGHGLGAAAAMGQLRSAVRALASTGLGPGRLLAALEQYTRRHGIGQMTTLVYAQLGLSSGVLRYACAGHPPPLIVAPGRAPELVWGGRSMPLDTYPDHQPARQESTHSLPTGSTLLLYTDGLFERRGRGAKDGLDRLLSEAAVRPRDDAAAFVAGMLRALHDPEHRDDVCLLAVRLEF
jgi:sigma-B regulation protein RsbU (phosphoserine phosphatase)